jgi:uncharacterized damage-inducible protein DinB
MVKVTISFWRRYIMNNFKEYLFTTREQLLNEISSLNDDEFNRIFEINKWSMAQICHHLLKTEILFREAILFGLDQRILSNTERKPIQIVSDRSQNQVRKIFNFHRSFNY